jgi:serine/threonine protein kinase/Tol biopolymer transport system component
MHEGASISGYRIVAPLGAGGMGEVWRATDSRLGREVALKLLPADVADDPDRLARFEREAKMLASLNHPNIATLYGLERAAWEEGGHAELGGIPRLRDPADRSARDDGAGTYSEGHAELEGVPRLRDPADRSARNDARPVTFLVMELVEGKGLDEVIAKGALPVGEAIAIGVQIAEALEAAHGQGIVHRDLKPANVKIRPDGTVKVLDFGLAKAWQADAANHSLSLSPTLTQHATAAGIILGTAGYMAPEQAAGTAADGRADIWAFGVVLWEMLTGRKLFEGETVSHVLASVLKDEPELAALPASTPPAIVDLISRCLRKKPRQRLQAMGDIRIALEEALADPQGSGTTAPTAPTAGRTMPSAPSWRRYLPWAAAAALGLGLAAALLLPRVPAGRVVKATIPPPEATSFDLRASSPGPAVVSPDGAKIAFTAIDEDSETRIFVRRLDAGEAQALSGTEGAQYPFWAPDSRWLGFFSQPDDLLRKIDTNGGPPITLCAAANGKGASWSPDGVIVFSPEANSALSRVSAAGGEAAPLTTLDPEKHNSHRLPWFLPDGRRFLFVARGVAPDDSAIMVGSLDGGEPVELMRGTSQAAYASGRILFVRDGTLMAQDFDPGSVKLTSEAVPVAEEVLVVQGASLAVFGVSGNGVLAYQSGSAVTETTLEWRSREGVMTAALGDPAVYRLARLSPDGRHAVVQVVDVESGTPELWIYEVERGIRTRFTFDPMADVSPTWSPDGETVYFASNRDGVFAVYRKPLSGVGEVERVHGGKFAVFPDDVSPDGRRLALLAAGEGSGGDILLVDLAEGGEPREFRVTEFNEGGSAISPDGRWLAFHSDESGDFEVFVTTFPTPGRRWQVSEKNGVYPAWRADGREIVYSDFAGNLVAVQVDGGGETFDVGAAESLFTIEAPEQGGAHYSMTGDGRRFLVVPGITQTADTLLNLVVDWPATVEARR